MKEQIKHQIGDIVDIDFGIGGRLFCGYVSGVKYSADKVYYNITLKVGSIEEDLFTEIKDVDSVFVKPAKDE
jgi:hypothetical protein